MIFCARPRSTRTERSELSSLRFRIEFRQRLRSRRYYIPWAEERPVFRDLLLVPSKFRRLQSGWLNSWSNPAALPRLERLTAGPTQLRYHDWSALLRLGCAPYLCGRFSFAFTSGKAALELMSEVS